MRQLAPRPDPLYDLVSRLQYRPGWEFSLLDLDRGQGSEGLTLIITTQGYNSYHADRGETYHVHHYIPVPPAAYDERSWQRWLFEQLLLVERHECMEFFAFRVVSAQHSGEFASLEDEQRGLIRPYAPSHGPGNDPYIVRELATEADQRTSFRGEVKA
jgi:hypothetical protein